MFKNAARLSCALLVRKGRAEPAQGGYDGSNITAFLTPLPDNGDRGSSHALRRQPVDAAATTSTLIRCDDATVDAQGEISAGERRVAMTLRLDQQRYTRLKILSARTHRTAQDLLSEALETFLERRGNDCACMRETASAD